MRARTLALLLVLFACKKDEVPAAGAPVDKRARCEKVGDQLTQMGMLMAHGLVGGLSEGKEQLGNDEAAKLKAELDAMKSELVEKCMGWSDETIGCFGTGAILNSKKCEGLIAEAMGDPVPPADVPAGPAQAWSFTLPQEQAILHGNADGSVLAVYAPDGSDDGPARGATIVAIADGKPRWEKQLPAAPWSIEPIDDATVMLVTTRELVAIAIADGSESWRAAIPAGQEEDPEPPAAIGRDGQRWTMIDAERRVLTFDAARCAKPKCIEVVGKLAEDDPETHLGIGLSGPVGLARVPDGGLVIVMPDEQRLVVLDEKLGLRFAIAGRVALSWAEQRGGELVVALDGELIGVDASKCGSKGDTYAPATWPPPGNPDWLRDSTPSEGPWDAAPPECVKWRRAIAVAEGADAPVEGFGDAMIVQAGGFLFALTPSAEQWKTSTAAQSFAVKHGERIAVLGDVGTGGETELAMMWIDPATGQHVGRTPTALGKGEYFLMDGPGIVSAGPVLIAGFERELVAFAAP